MADLLEPQDAASAVEAVADALASRTPLELTGHGSKRGYGRPVAATRQLSARKLAAVDFYEPEELVLKAGAGVPLAEVEALLGRAGQHLAFEPMDLGPLLGGPAGGGTLAGVVACNLSGPRRPFAGAARDHVLGIEAVSGRGDLLTTGSRVVKNVTGYDLPKLLTGSFGTLAFYTSLTLKTLPAPERAVTLVLEGLSDEAAIAAMTRALTSALEVSGAAHLPAGFAGYSEGGARTLLRLEGFAVSVADRQAALEKLLGGLAPCRMVEGEECKALWQAVRDVRPLVEPAANAVWRLSVPPSEGAKVMARLRRELGVSGYYDWGGGLLWVAIAPGFADAGAGPLRAALGEGHATLIRAPEAVRAAVPVFHPQSPALAALAARVKDSFDPENLLGPGRMVAGSERARG